MTLYDILRATKYDQRFSCYLTNNYDQNLPIGFGTRRELLDEEINDELFDFLMCPVSLLTIAKDGALVVRLTDEHFNERIEDRFPENQTKMWSALNPGSRPYKFSSELEDFGHG